MTVQQIIKQTEKFTIDQKQQLGYYMLFTTLNEEKKYNLMQLFDYKIDSEILQPDTKKDIGETIDGICGPGKNLWNEDAQGYINKLREDDRTF